MQQLPIVTNYGRFSKAKGIELLVFFEMCYQQKSLCTIHQIIRSFCAASIVFLIKSKKAKKLLLYKKDLKIATAW